MKPRFTYEQHAEMGGTLAAIRDELNRRHVQVMKAYPLQGPEAKAQRELQKALVALDNAKWALENLLLADDPNASLQTYNPHGNARPTLVVRARTESN